MKIMLRRMIVLAVSVALLLTVALVSATPITVSGNGTINPGQITDGRLYRGGGQSGCSPAKAYPGTYNVGTAYGYTVEGPFTVAVDSCITVTWSRPVAYSNVHPIAFRNGFDPNWMASGANYLGDPGDSSVFSFSFPVSAGETFVLVFQNVRSRDYADYSYSFTYEPVMDGSLHDGRLNRFDVAGPLAVYPVAYADGLGLHLYGIDANGTGWLALEVTPEMIAAVPEMPTENTLIASTPDGSVALYRLFTGEFQINAAPDYEIVFSDLTSTADYYYPQARRVNSVDHAAAFLGVSPLFCPGGPLGRHSLTRSGY